MAIVSKEEVGQEEIKKFYDFCKSSINMEVASYLEACVRCGICAEACLFYMGENVSGRIDPTLTPAYKADLLREIYKENYTLLGRFKKLLGFGVKITPEDLKEQVRLAFYTCTNCDRCTKACPMGIDTPRLVSIVRGALTSAGLTPKDLAWATNLSVEKGSPLGVDVQTFLQRMEFIQEEYEVEVPIDQKPADYLYLPSSIELMKFPSSVAAAAKVLNASGASWSMSTVAHEATNFGLFAQSKEVTREMLRRVLEGAKELGARYLITPECGHAYQSMRFVAPNIFPEDWSFEVLNIVEFIHSMIREGKLRIGGKVVKERVTLHDSCQIGRRGGVLKEPRELLNMVAEDFKDSVLIPEHNICCGGGGGVLVIEDADYYRQKAFISKMALFDKAGAKTVVCYCANCMLALTKGAQELKRDYKFVSLVELVAEALEEEKT
ncbi:MAG: (Fe-S)-binding protein [Aquificaceae bacterium]|nr:(Fe-S)-binding protein [Aquificaceae bacterium]